MNRLTDYRFVLMYGAPLEYDGESHKNKYNWMLSNHGDYTGLETVRRSTWQTQLAVI